MDDIKIDKVSVVCPFYNESAIIEKAARGMLENLRGLKDRLNVEWELIAVNDGSKDDSVARIEKVLAGEPRAKLITYSQNQGRGFALKTGIDAATGDIIVTTEMDLSWGDGVVTDIVKAFLDRPHLDFVIASPNLPGGGYKNVPRKRVWVSKLGNQLLRMLFTKQITMNTGMTRGYRRDVIQGLETDEKEKEFHLEVLFKLLMMKYQFAEIPAVLEWKDEQLKEHGTPKRKSSSSIAKLIFSHLHFAAFANPIRYFWTFAVLCALIGMLCLASATYRLMVGEVAIYVALIGMTMTIVALLFFGFGILSSQNNRILKELWTIQMQGRKRCTGGRPGELQENGPSREGRTDS
jgi:glycosyltransferase involved in cell wall biosynthesis